MSENKPVAAPFDKLRANEINLGFPSDAVGKSDGQQVDHAVEAASDSVTPGKLDFYSIPVVGIGASAGGLGAFKEFFGGMPSGHKPGMAFVLVQHLSPEHQSLLSELIRQYTSMPVFEVVDAMMIAIDSVYVIPPGLDMALVNGCLRLSEPLEPPLHRLPINFFSAHWRKASASVPSVLCSQVPAVMAV